MDGAKINALHASDNKVTDNNKFARPDFRKCFYCSLNVNHVQIHWKRIVEYIPPADIHVHWERIKIFCYAVELLQHNFGPLVSKSERRFAHRFIGCVIRVRVIRDDFHGKHIFSAVICSCWFERVVSAHSKACALFDKHKAFAFNRKFFLLYECVRGWVCVWWASGTVWVMYAFHVRLALVIGSRMWSASKVQLLFLRCCCMRCARQNEKIFGLKIRTSTFI